MGTLDLATARTLNRPVLVVLGTFPSPWGEAAKGLFHLKKLELPIIRARANDPELSAWTGIGNLPALMVPGEPTHSNWAEIITGAERLGGAVPLVPTDPEERARLFGWVHELAGEWGLGWCSRLVMIHASVESQGTVGFPAPVAGFLAPKYGYSAASVPSARVRITQVLALFARQLESRSYLLGTQPTAADVYLACFLTPLVGLTEEECPGLRPALRAAFTALASEVGDGVTPELRAHRTRMFREHLEWPIRL